MIGTKSLSYHGENDCGQNAGAYLKIPPNRVALEAGGSMRVERLFKRTSAPFQG